MPVSIMSGVRVASGPEAAFATDKIRRQVEARDAWPFPWVYPGPDSSRRNPTGYIVTPAVGVTAAILTFTVPQGYVFDMQGLLLCAVTTGMVLIGNPGDFTFSVDRNTPVGGGALQGGPLADLTAVPFNLGSPSIGPMPLSRAETFQGNDVIRAKITNVSGAAGAPNYGIAIFSGWLRVASKG